MLSVMIKPTMLCGIMVNMAALSVATLNVMASFLVEILIHLTGHNI
jgi:hypothetical protein